MSVSSTEAPNAVDALQECLAGEHQALWAYGLIGGVMAGVDPGGATYDHIRADYDAHQEARDNLMGRIQVLGEEPVAADVAYGTPRPVTDEASAAALARRIETRLAATYAGAVARSVQRDRAIAADGLIASTLRAQAWDVPPTALPGL